jgi:hypothetical protein
VIGKVSFNMLKLAATTVFLWLAAVSEVLAMGNTGGGGRGLGGGDRGGGGGTFSSAPEIDGPGGVAAIALLVGAGLMVHNRYKKK